MKQRQAITMEVVSRGEIVLMEPLYEALPRSKVYLTGSLLQIDDDKTFCEVVSDALTHRGFVVAVAHGVEDGLRRVKSSLSKLLPNAAPGQLCR